MHRHEEPREGRLVDAARDAIRAAGEQWTPLRASVFEVLATFSKPASAYDITEALSALQGRRVAANSVYRILDLFVAANLALRVESANAYLANAHPGCRHDCIFLICNRCGQTTHVDDDLVGRKVRQTAEKAGFAAERPILEVRGLCGRCSGREDGAG